MVKEGKILAAYIGGGVMLLLIAVLNFAGELSEDAVGGALNLYKPIGPYSGKILFGFLGGLIVWIISHYALKEKKVDVRSGLIFFIIALVIATIFVFTPFIHLF